MGFYGDARIAITENCINPLKSLKRFGEDGWFYHSPRFKSWAMYELPDF
jgi:hypothetical protein